jgi:diguanylate cyclase (GGDEF)-like protein
MDDNKANSLNKANAAAATASNSTGLWIALLIVLLCVTLFILVSALSGQGEAPLISKQVKYHIASSTTDNIQTVMQLGDPQWQSIHNSNFGMSSEAYWFKIDIPPTTSEDPRLIEVSYATLDFVDVWFVDQTQPQALILSQIKSGDNLAFKQREIKHDQLVFAVPDSAIIISLYLRVKTQGIIMLRLKLWHEEQYIEFIGSHRVFIGVFYGFMAAMGLFNLFLFVTSRNISTLLFAAYVICLSLMLASSQGLGYRFLWPESVVFQKYSILVFVSLMVYFASSFTARLLDMKYKFKTLCKFCNAISIAIFFYIACLFILPFGVMVSLLIPMMLIAIFFVFSTTVYIGFKGITSAKYLSAAWGFLLFSALFAMAESNSWLNLKLDPIYLLMAGAAIEILFMALALAMQFNTQRLAAQRAYLEAGENKQKTMQAKEALMRLQKHIKKRLESAVGERSYELEIAIRELNEANQELERKSSIDALTGVANRRLYDKKILAEARRSRREKTPLAIAMIDIDHFKSVNDTYGHQAGDAALKHFAGIVNECIKRPSDTICRYGGEEFVAILPNTDLDGATALMEMVRLMTEGSQLDFEGDLIKFTVSIGVSTRVIVADAESELLHAFADKLLYKAKEAGRNQVISGEF